MHCINGITRKSYYSKETEYKDKKSEFFNISFKVLDVSQHLLRPTRTELKNAHIL